VTQDYSVAGVPDLRLQPVTDAGLRFAELAEQHAVDAAGAAAKNDDEGRFPVELFDGMKATGFLSATVPVEFGGMGVASVRDLGVGLSRLAHGDGSVAIASTMHLGFGLIGRRLLADARESGNTRIEESISGLLSLLGSGAVAMANFTEAGTDLRHPNATAIRVDGGWSITGRKTFSTLSEIADVFFVSVRIDTDRGPVTRSAFVPRGTPGQRILSNWDALGMRASGSHDVIYENCVVPDDYVLPGGEPWGEDSELTLRIATVGQFPLIAVFLGIAEHASSLAQGATRSRLAAGGPRAESGRGGLQHLVGENEIDLVAGRAIVDHTGRLVDTYLTAEDAVSLTVPDLHRLHAAFQCGKQAVNRLAIKVVDRSMTVVGGSAYQRRHPMARLYRDVRAGPLMQPYSPVEAHQYIAEVLLAE
jgi:alkylation response protein AidB-like acyl-CoA dehydrogenase